MSSQAADLSALRRRVERGLLREARRRGIITEAQLDLLLRSRRDLPL